MSSHVGDPPVEVAAPVHRALNFLILRGAASFAVAVTAVLVTVVEPAGHAHLVGHAALPLVLLFVTVARLVHTAVERRPWDGELAWSRTLQVDRTETWIAAVVAVLVPIAWALGGASILVRHVGSPDELAGVFGFWLPLGAGLWFAATLAWFGDCRERLARALEASDEAFRAYWAGVGRPR